MATPGRPGGPLRLLPLRPRAHVAAQDHRVPRVSTVIRCASTSALRFSAASICAFTTAAVTVGLTTILLVMPLTPRTGAHGALSGLLLVVPFHRALQRHPAVGDLRFHAVGRDGGIRGSALATERAMSSSLRWSAGSKPTSSSLATALTPVTRAAARAAPFSPI